MAKYGRFSVEESRRVMFQVLIAILFPFVGSILYCLVRGTSFFTLFLPNSYNNDVLFYYKLVEGLCDGGITGFFGFNESHALHGGFAAWNPLILVPFFIAGKIFGWTYMTPIICNIVLFSIALAVFVILVKPKWNQLICALIILALFPSFWIHMMNSLPEIVITSILIIVVSALISYVSSGSNIALWVSLILSGYLTIVRPYMVLFFLFALLFLLQKKRLWSTISAIVSLCIVGIAYVLISRYLTADYFAPLYDMSMLKALGHFKFNEALSIAKDSLKIMFPGILSFLKGAFVYGSTAGTQYIMFSVALAGSIVLMFCDIFTKKKNKDYVSAYFIYILSGLGLTFAIFFLLVKPNEGGRHVFSFAILGIILVSLGFKETVGKIFSGAIGILLIIFLIRGSLVPTDYDIPMEKPGLASDIAYWEENFKASDETGYDNTIIWPLYDFVDGNVVITNYNELYGIPSKMGISCCFYDYVTGNIDNLKCKYAAVPAGGTIEAALIEKGVVLVGRTNDLAIYKLK